MKKLALLALVTGVVVYALTAGMNEKIKENTAVLTTK